MYRRGSHLCVIDIAAPFLQKHHQDGGSLQLNDAIVLRLRRRQRQRQRRINEQRTYSPAKDALTLHGPIIQDNNLSRRVRVSNIQDREHGSGPGIH